MGTSLINVEEVQQTFASYDKSNLGHISLELAHQAMKDILIQVNDNLFNRMIQTYHISRSGNVTCAEFINMVNASRDEEFRGAFNMFDLNSDGFIDFHELRRLLTALGEDMRDTDLKSFMNEADSDGDGRINYEEFVMVINAKNKLSALRSS